jgi:hypothetical protein
VSEIGETVVLVVTAGGAVVVVVEVGKTVVLVLASLSLSSL